MARRLPLNVLFFLILLVLALGRSQTQSQGPFNRLQLAVVPQSILTHPVIDSSHPGAAGNQFGFEGGSVVKLGGAYHLFTSEMYAAPRWESMRLAHWTSPDAIHWTRAATLYETRPGETGPRHALWAPMPVFDALRDRWNLFYVAYASPGNAEGSIWRAISKQSGKSGIGGPYKDVAIVMQRNRQSQWWEGSQGDDSFFPFQQADGKWLAFYGSHENAGGDRWYVGLASSPSLAGPWRRLKKGNPLKNRAGLHGKPDRHEI